MDYQKARTDLAEVAMTLSRVRERSRAWDTLLGVSTSPFSRDVNRAIALVESVSQRLAAAAQGQLEIDTGEDQ